MWQEDLQHWGVIFPVATGILTGAEINAWTRKNVNPFDISFLIGVIGFVGFFISPLMVLSFGDQLVVDGVMMNQSRKWIGYTCALYFFGYQFFLIGRKIGYRKKVTLRTFWCIDQKFLLLALFVIFIQVLCQFIYINSMGGIQGWLKYRTIGSSEGNTVGLGPVMVAARSLPILYAIYLTYLMTGLKPGKNKSLISTAVFLASSIAIQIIVSGLSGSRNSIIYSCIWFLYLCHIYWRPIGRKAIVAIFSVFFVFMYIVGFYKSLGSGVYDIYKRDENVNAILEAAPNRNIRNMIIGDLSRVDVNAAQLFILFEKPWEYQYRLGLTYIDSIVPLIPKKIWRTKTTDSGKVIAGTEMLYGPGGYNSRNEILRYAKGNRSTRIYGLLGEWLLNFGIILFVFPYFICGFIVARFDSFCNALYAGDARKVLLPAGIILSFCIFINDFSNHVAFILYVLAIPLMLLIICTKRMKVVHAV